MFSLGPLHPNEQESYETDDQLKQQHAACQLALSDPLPADSKHAAGMQPPWSAGSVDRPTSAVASSRQRPTSAAVKRRANASGNCVKAVNMQQEAAEPGHKADSEQTSSPAAPRFFPLRKARPHSGHTYTQRQKHHVPSPASQHLQQQQQQVQQQQLPQQHQQHPASPALLTAMQLPKDHAAAGSSKMKSAVFLQQELLQAPTQRLPEAIADLIAAANSRIDPPMPVYISNSQTAAAAGKRHATIINMGSSNSTTSDDKNNAAGSSDHNNRMLDSSYLRQGGCLTVLGSIQEEDTAVQQHDVALDLEQQVLPSVKSTSVVSFNSSSCAHPGDNRPTLSTEDSEHPHSRPACSPSGRSIKAQKQQRQQRDDDMSAADRGFYGCLATSCNRPRSRPWSTAVTKEAKKLYGYQAMQSAAPGLQQHRRCESAHPFYSVDTRLMARKDGKFSPSISLAASRGAGFRVQQLRLHSSQALATVVNSSNSSSDIHITSDASAAAVQAAAVNSLNNSLTASHISSRQKWQRQRQYSSSVSSASSDYIQEVASEDSDLAVTQQERMPLHTMADQVAATEENHPKQQQQQQQQHQQCDSRPSTAASQQTMSVLGAAVSNQGLLASDTHMRYRLAASSPVAAATLVAANLRQKQQECKSAARAATKLMGSLEPDYCVSTHRRSDVLVGRSLKVSYGTDGCAVHKILSSSRKGSR